MLIELVRNDMKSSGLKEKLEKEAGIADEESEGKNKR